MENLNSDIMLEIISRLPKTNTSYKTVLQCREVCKLWRDLLGKPKTGMLFLISSENYSDCKLYYREGSSEMISLNCMKEPQDFYKMLTEISNINTGAWSFSFVGTCNGLVCYVILGFIYIHDPITGELIRIPKKGSEYNTDPVGFGYCHSTNTYKIVRIGQCTANGKRSVKVYTLGEGNGWRHKPQVTYMLYGSGVYSNGAVHWLNTRSNCDIVAFDLTDETFRSIPPPPCQPNYHMDVDLGWCGGNLHLCHFYRNQGEGMMDIWVYEKKNMNNCTNFNSFTWIRRFSKKWDNCLTRLLSRTDSEILLWQNHVLSCYDPATYKKIWYSEDAEETVCEAIPHMHSLVSLKDLGEERVDSLLLPKKIATR